MPISNIGVGATNKLAAAQCGPISGSSACRSVSHHGRLAPASQDTQELAEAVHPYGASGSAGQASV